MIPGAPGLSTDPPHPDLAAATPLDRLRHVLHDYWGYDGFRPLQVEAMTSVLAHRDSVVVLPTGGGKSLCFQAPALCLPGMALVISPLISLMKDQVDALSDCGVPAALINSSLSAEERGRVAQDVRGGRIKLLYISPERLTAERTVEFLKGVELSFVAVDEAHCISSWGHDFRPEYRGLRLLKEAFPGIAVHAYTATATEQVRDDIANELHLKDPAILVGSFDRPNLVYRVQRRADRLRQICDVIDRHRDESGIVYCIRRADVEELTAALNQRGYRALPYHAGMEDADRRRSQEAFIQENVETIVATVAFGMGIDKSNVRYVIHAAAPKSLESYQQESGRAGRDGLEAECWLFHSAGDFQTWRSLQADLEPQAFEIAMTTLAGIEEFCTGVACRHKWLVEYFGQSFESENCGACDVCLSELDLVEDSLVVAQKILSCVVRLQQNFGGDYTAQVLAGSREQRILDRQHDKLSTWGLLAHENKTNVRAWIEQLVGQGYLLKAGEYRLLQITPTGRQVLRGEVHPRLLKPAQKRKDGSKSSSSSSSKLALQSWEGVDRRLFDVLRALRRKKADERSIPAFVVFGDATLRELARRRPSTQAALREVHGIGDKKSADYGPEFLEAIVDYCRENSVALDAEGPRVLPPAPPVPPRSTGTPQGAKQKAWEMFAQGRSIAEVAQAIGRAPSTAAEYLAGQVESEQIVDVSAWVDDAVWEQVRGAAAVVGTEKLKPIFERLEGAVPYDQIRIAVAALRNQTPPE
jgi:ATP-dependent DNA helicase RecQ